jgi:hypothetical protein
VGGLLSLEFGLLSLNLCLEWFIVFEIRSGVRVAIQSRRKIVPARGPATKVSYCGEDILSWIAIWIANCFDRVVTLFEVWIRLRTKASTFSV